MNVCVVLYSKDKRHNQDKEARISYRQRTKTKIPPEAWMFLLRVVSKDKRQNTGQ
jgi:hypothetical protein